jgi:hypothetical protein
MHLVTVLLLLQVLGLSLLGSKHAATWKPHEELLFCLGM